MADDRGRPLVIGALTAVTGAVLFLAAGDVIPLPDQTFGGPRWLVGLLGLGCFFGGCYAIALALPTPRMRRLLGGRREPDILTAGALLSTWLALTGGGSGRFESGCLVLKGQARELLGDGRLKRAYPGL